MNKVIILLLVVCLVSVHAYVKRDAPAPQQDIFGDAKKFVANGLKEIQDKLNPDAIKKTFGETLDTINKALADLKPTEAPKA